MAMKKPSICAAIVNSDLEAIREIEPLVELLEVRIDLIGDGWEEIATQLKKPWIACNRNANEGGRWQGDETTRINELIRAIELGASIVDIELRTGNIKETIQIIKRKAKCLVSLHEFRGTPLLDNLKKIVQQQLTAGADICKVVTTAQSFEDNLTVLQLIQSFPETRIVAFAMGELGLISRALCPMVGGEFTYASIKKGMKSASGQLTVRELRKLYEIAAR